MLDRPRNSRRTFVLGATALLGTTLLTGCDGLGKKPWFRQLLDKDEDANLFVQRLLLSDRKLAPEFTAAELSPKFKANGTEDPSDKAYKALAKNGFRSYRLEVGGLVERPELFTLAALRAMPSRTQITRHDCVEGWSCIGQWTGVPLADVLQRVGLKPQARFIVFYCADSMDSGDNTSDDDQEPDDDDKQADADQGKAGDKSAGGDAKANMTPDDKAAQQPDTGGKAAGKKTEAKAAAGQDNVGDRYYESIDLEDAFHPLTILAYDMNGQTLPVAHGAPLRLRVERQLGYKHAKYIVRIEVVDSLDKIGKGGGGYWEDNGYEWYAGI